MQFKRDVPVFSAEGKRIGAVSRVVIDPRTDGVTHLVLTKTSIPDAVFENDKVLPVAFVQEAGEERITLGEEAPAWDALQNFKETLYIARREEENRAIAPTYARRYYWYPFSDTKSADPEHLVYPHTQLYTATQENIPPGNIALQEGAQVISADERALGYVSRVFADAETGKVTHFAVRENESEWIIPAWWVKRFQELAVKLAVEERIIKKLNSVRD